TVDGPSIALGGLAGTRCAMAHQIQAIAASRTTPPAASRHRGRRLARPVVVVMSWSPSVGLGGPLSITGRGRPDAGAGLGHVPEDDAAVESARRHGPAVGREGDVGQA